MLKFFTGIWIIMSNYREFIKDKKRIVIKIGSDNTIEQDYRTLEKSCLKEMGFKNLAVYIDHLSNGRIAIFGV